MSEPLPPGQKFELYKLLAPIFGALLSIVGGFGAVFIRSRVEKKQEIDYLKINLTDELHDVCSIIGHMTETYRTSEMVSNTYLNELAANTETLKSHKQKLYLIHKEELRREIIGFIKNLEEVINESRNKVGTLGEKPTGGVHDKMIGKFTTISTSAHTLKTNLGDYKYRPYWFNSI